MCCAILCLLLLDIRAYSHSLKGPKSPKPSCDSKFLRSYLSPPVFTVRSGRQDLAMLSPEGSHDNTFQLRGWVGEDGREAGGRGTCNFHAAGESTMLWGPERSCEMLDH